MLELKCVVKLWMQMCCTPTVPAPLCLHSQRVGGKEPPEETNNYLNIQEVVGWHVNIFALWMYLGDWGFKVWIIHYTTVCGSTKNAVEEPVIGGFVWGEFAVIVSSLTPFRLFPPSLSVGGGGKRGGLCAWSLRATACPSASQLSHTDDKANVILISSQLLRYMKIHPIQYVERTELLRLKSFIVCTELL